MNIYVKYMLFVPMGTKYKNQSKCYFRKLCANKSKPS